MKKKRVYYAPMKRTHVDPKTCESLTCPNGYPMNGANFVADLDTWMWRMHDVACDRKTWDSGKPMTARDASRVLKIVGLREGRVVRARVWGLFTLLATSPRWGKKKGRMHVSCPEKAGTIEMIEGGVKSLPYV